MREHVVDGCCLRRRVEILDDVHRLLFPTDLSIVVKRRRENIRITDYRNVPTALARQTCCFRKCLTNPFIYHTKATKNSGLLARDGFVRTTSRYCHGVLPSVRPSVCLSVWEGRALWSYGASNVKFKKESKAGKCKAFRHTVFFCNIACNIRCCVFVWR